MLIQFSFKNYKSFKNETLLDMTATSIKEHPYNLIETDNGSKYLKLAAIYGGNASGKSNVIDAFDFMRYLVINSLTLEKEENKYKKSFIPIKSFIFDNNSNTKTSEFQVFFIYKDIEYQYGFVVDKEKVHEEWLYSKTPKGKKYDTLFERIGNEIECGKKMQDADKFKDSVDETTLFLSLTAKTKIKPSKAVYQWFYNNFIVNFGDINFEKFISRSIPDEILKKDQYKIKLEEFLIAIDTGIKGISVEKIGKSKESDENIYEVYSHHIVNEKGDTRKIPFDEESSGTKKMFCLFVFFFDALQNGYTLFIDELNAKLHPLLVRYIINMFHDSSKNINNAQLIFTTHDVFSLTKDTFRRDEVWFTEKDKMGISKLFSLAEYKLDDNSKVRSDATYFKDYTSGRYGAIPLLKEFNILEG